MSNTPRDAQPRFGLLRLIALYKLLKVLLLLAAAYGVLRMRDASVIARIYSWASTLPSGLEQDFVHRLLVWFSGLSSKRVEALGLGTLAYAALFSVEGVGLWMRRRWAEWLTIVITSSLIPLEIYEFFRHPTIGRFSVLAINVAIVAYLVVQVRAAPAASAEVKRSSS
jgi:uncharacterized membrane protein (DUF2068 family)